MRACNACGKEPAATEPLEAVNLLPERAPLFTVLVCRACYEATMRAAARALAYIMRSNGVALPWERATSPQRKS